MARALLALAVLVGAILPAGCSAPPEPPEVEQARVQEIELVRARAHEYAPARFEEYRAQLSAARDSFLKERAGLAPFVNYDEIADQYRAVLQGGKSVLAEAEVVRSGKEEGVRGRIARAEDSMADLYNLIAALNERRGPGRNMMKADLALREARSMLLKGDYAASSARLDEAEEYREEAVGALRALLGRYADSEQILKWRRMVNAAIEKSKSSGGKAIVIKKIERSLVLYEKGIAVKTYRVGLGLNGLSDKLRAGDNATPEGNYHITKKIPHSAYNKALLINYPNEEDKKRFAKARSGGLIPAGASIGGLVEIHGGGSTSVTRGCVSLEDREIEELYRRVAEGTPVVIVGTTELDSALAAMVGSGK